MKEQLGWLDTNLFIHALYANDPHRQRCLATLQMLQDGAAEGWIDALVVHELTYNLSRRDQFRTRSDVHNYIRNILVCDNIRADDKGAILDALMLWATKNLGFVDAWLTVQAQRRGIPVCSVNRRDFPNTRNTYFSAESAEEADAQC